MVDERKPVASADSSFGWLRERVESYGDQPFMVVADRTSTYCDLARRMDELAGQLESSKLPGGSIVVVKADFSLDAVAAIITLAERSCIVVPVSDAISESQIEARVESAQAQWFWDLSDGQNRLEPTAHRQSGPHELIQRLCELQHPGLILFSSGSAGTPKALVHDFNSLVDVYRNRKPRRMSLLSFLLFDHIGGLNTLFNAIAMGALVVVPGERNAESVARLIVEHSVRLLPTTPTFLNLMLMAECHKKFDLSSLRIITYGTEPMPEGLLARLSAAFPRARLLQTFGTSETGISQTASKSSSSTFMRFDDPNLEYKIVEGELWLKSRTRMLGYLNHSNERLTDDGWFKTGDQVEQSGDGFLRIVGRKTELLNVGGEKVTPLEVEGVLMQIPEIQDCRVYAIPSAITGQLVAADVVVANEDSAKTIKRTIRKHCRGLLEPYKIPTRIKIVAATEFSDRFKKRRVAN